MDENPYRSSTTNHESGNSDLRSRIRTLTWDAARMVAGASGGTVVILGVILLAIFYFKTGWANAWSLPEYRVWAPIMMVALAAQFVLASAAVSILLSYFAERLIKKAFAGWSLFVLTMILIVTATLIAFPILHHFLMTAIEEVWL